MTARTILITGASSGIGAALARIYAVPGTHLMLWGRDEQRLNAVVSDARQLGATVEIALVDVGKVDTMADRLREADARTPIALAIFNAGLGGTAPDGQVAESPERARDIALVNFASPVVGATVLSDLMARRGGGHIVLVGSMAESFPLPMSPTYSGTKAGLAMYAEALGLRMQRHGVAVTLVSPGFIDTPMSRSVASPKPFLMTAEACAAVIARKVSRRPARIVVPWQFTFIRGLARLLPRAVTRGVLRRY